MSFGLGPTRRAAALVLGGVLLVAGCSSSDDDPPREQPTSEPSSADTEPTAGSETPTDAPSIEPGVSGVGFDPDARLELPEENVKLARLSDTTLFTVTDKTVTAHALGSAEVDFESAAGDIGTWMDLWVDEDGEEVLALRMDQEVGSGTAIGEVSAALVRIDPETGDVQLVARMALPDAAQGTPHLEVRDVVDDVAIVEKWVEGAGGRTVQAVDLDRGRSAWVRKDVSFLGSTDDLVILNKGNVFVPGRLIALRPDGKEAWKGYEGVGNVALVGIHRGVLTVAGNDASHSTPVLTRVNTRNGRTVGRPRAVKTTDWRCTHDEGDVAVCQDGFGGLRGVDLEENRVAWGLPTGRRYAPTMTAVHEGNLYGFLNDGRSVVIDAATGKDVGPAGAAPTEVNESGGVVLFVGKAVWFPFAE